MWQIVIVPTDNKANAALFFDRVETAEIAHKQIYDAQKGSLPVQVLKVTDDFGCTLTIDKDKICCVMMMESEKQMKLAAAMGGNKPQGGFNG